MEILNSLKDESLWGEVDLASVDQRFWAALSNPRFIAEKPARVNVAKSFQERETSQWHLILQTAELNERTTIIQLEDHEKFQYVVLCAGARRIAGSWQVRVLRIYKSQYNRKHPRVRTQGSGWHITHIAVHSTRLDPHKRKTLIRTIFQSYRQHLQKKVKRVLVDQYTRQDDSLLKEIHRTSKAFFLKDSEDLSAYSTPTKLNLGNQTLECAAFGDLLPDRDPQRIRVKYRDISVRSDLIVPILFPDDDGRLLNLGYIRAYPAPGAEDQELTDERIQHILETRESIINSIKASNYETFADRQELVDASMEGLGFEFSDPQVAARVKDAVNFQCRLHHHTMEDPLKCSVRKIHQSEKGATLRVGVRVTDMQFVKPDLTAPEATGMLAYRKAVRSLAMD